MVYSFNGVNDKVPVWGYLRRIAGTTVGPWSTERVGGNVPSTEMEPFKDCVADCGVLDIAATGSLFTWNNKQKPEEKIYSRLDRVLVNKAWCNHLPDLYAYFLPEGMYDHTPCIVSSSKKTERKRSFKYFNMWGRYKDIVPIVRSNWQVNVTGTPMFKLVEELQVQLGRDPSDLLLRTAEYEATLQLKELSTARDGFLSKKAKHKWVKDKDSNSAFFHGLLKQRKHGNKVLRVEDIYGKGPSWSPGDCSILLRPVNGKEVRDAVFSILDIKSPGPDGYTKFLPAEKVTCTNQCHLIRLYERPNASSKCLFKIDLQKAYDTVEWKFVETLLRMLKFQPEFQTKYDFNYHPMCKQQRLACLMFADDVFMFSEGDTRGVPDQIKQDILSVPGFAEGLLPFKNLGMPIQTTRLKKWIVLAWLRRYVAESIIMVQENSPMQGN
ncbi:uncharacterized protein LOC141595295 [Silene latifolia]|uniref:uncharacterized protein LOC141595295 n=1 Tax=Silene latifolia TaxID=37657 RepID=UPI003D76DB93